MTISDACVLAAEFFEDADKFPACRGVLRDAAAEIERLRAALGRIAEPEAFFVATSDIDPEALGRMLYAQKILSGSSFLSAEKTTEEELRARFLPEAAQTHES